MFSDKNGDFNTIYESASFLEKVSPVPVFDPYYNGVGEGFFGKKVVYHFELGRQAALKAVDILNGRLSQTPNSPFLFFLSILVSCLNSSSC